MSMQLKLPATTTRSDPIALGGGLDLLTPLLRLRPGYVRDAQNWEQSVNGGYSRISGYERHDGRAAPSSATYLTITVTLSVTPAIGSTLTGVTSAATGVLLSIDTSSGSTVLAYTRSTGAFVAGETLNVSASPVGTVVDVGGSGTAARYDAMQRSLAANVYRALIGAVPGSGPVRGGFLYKGVDYAFRNNAGGTALALYKSSGAGWVLVPFLYELAFTAGSAAYLDGDSLVQGGVSATIKRVMLESGTFAGGTAAGRLIISAPAGGNFAGGALAGAGVATAGGIQTAIAMLPDGRVQTDTGNFGPGKRIYACDGVNRAFEFDGETLAPIKTGNSPDVPTNVLVHKDHLWLSFADNVQHSGIAAPFNWTAIAGSAAYRFDDSITAMTRQPGDQSTGTMSVCTLTSTSMVYGSSAIDFKVVPFEESAGARPYGAQRMSGGQTVVFGDIGVYTLSATQSFGNFEAAAMTMNIRPFTQTRRTQCTASLVNKEKSQYRVFFNDGYALYATLVNGRMVGTMPMFFPHRAFTAWRGDSPDGGETSFIGSDSGFVYRLDAGTSFDGSPIEAFFTLTFAAQGNARILKRYRRATFECQGDGYAEFSVTHQIGYGGEDRPQGDTPNAAPLPLSSVYWDAFTWDAFTWDGRSIAPTTMELGGTGENIALRVDSTSDLFNSFTMNSITIDFSVRRGLRG